ncbi:DsbA family protein [Paraburkholderia sp. C35]|uniref:DsbA family protein n=1 Tax=Paraburkholderia sp. C35 TaxID=2126993 RepID=UPI000D696AC9|nr:DsbA family protein [Paraburkholderia sp. C35]
MHLLSPPIETIDRIQGNPYAAVTLVEYGDFQCPYCGTMYGIIKEVQKALQADLRFAFRQFPLTNLHAHALHAAEFAEAADSAGKFWEAHDTLFENQTSLDGSALAKYASQLDIPLQRVHAAFDGDYDERIKRDFSSGLESGVQGTPTLFINGQRYDGEHDTENLLAALLVAARRV